MEIVTRKLDPNMAGPSYFAVTTEQQLLEEGYVWEFNCFQGGYCVRTGVSKIKEEKELVAYLESGMSRLEWETSHNTKEPTEGKTMSDHGYSPLSKYSSARDSILHYLCTVEWSNASFGDVAAPTGYVWRISNNWEEVKPINMEFTSVLEDWFTDNSEVTDSPELRKELVGHFLVIEDSNGFVHVLEFPSERDLKRDFAIREAQFEDWSKDEDEDEEANND